MILQLGQALTFAVLVAFFSDCRRCLPNRLLINPWCGVLCRSETTLIVASQVVILCSRSHLIYNCICYNAIIRRLRCHMLISKRISQVFQSWLLAYRCLYSWKNVNKLVLRYFCRIRKQGCLVMVLFGRFSWVNWREVVLKRKIEAAISLVINLWLYWDNMSLLNRSLVWQDMVLGSFYVGVGWFVFWLRWCCHIVRIVTNRGRKLERGIKD